MYRKVGGRKGSARKRNKYRGVKEYNDPDIKKCLSETVSVCILVQWIKLTNKETCTKRNQSMTKENNLQLHAVYCALTQFSHDIIHLQSPAQSMTVSITSSPGNWLWNMSSPINREPLKVYEQSVAEHCANVLAPSDENKLPGGILVLKENLRALTWWVRHEDSAKGPQYFKWHIVL